MSTTPATAPAPSAGGTKAPAKKASPKPRASAKKASTKKATAKKTTTAAAPATKSARVPLREREPKVLLEDAGYALAGVAADTVELVKQLPERFVIARKEFAKVADDAPERVRSLRGRIGEDLTDWIASLEGALDDKALEGRRIAETVRSDDRVVRLRDQTTSTRRQLKAALTSMRRTVDVAAEVVREHAEEETPGASG